MTDDQFKADMKELMATPAGARLAFRVIQSSGILSAATDGSEGRDLAVAAQARKNLGLEILSMLELGQPQSHSSGQPILTIQQALREEANQPQEKQLAKSRYDRTAELNDDED